ncbi:MAG: hypothetical protein ABIT05_01245 [Chitinophagaceae bacterium]
MYRDLVAAYNRGMDIVGGEKISLNKKAGAAHGVSEVVKLFKTNLCPDGWDFNIDEHFGKKSRSVRYHFTIYREAPFPNYWHFFEIKPIVKMLATKNPRLHDFFIVFLSSFIDKCGLPTWFNGGMRYADYHLPDHYYQLEHHLKHKETELKTPRKEKRVKIAIADIGDPYADDEDPAEIKENLSDTIEKIKARMDRIRVTLDDYEKGDAHRYAKLLATIKPRSPQSLLKSLQRFPGQHKLVKFMKQACEFMKRKARVEDFCYHYTEGHDQVGLGFDLQVTVMWNWSDHFTDCHCEMMDSVSQGCGVFSPTLHARFMPGVFKLDMEELKKSVDWTKELTSISTLYNDIASKLTDYNKERAV